MRMPFSAASLSDMRTLVITPGSAGKRAQAPQPVPAPDLAGPERRRQVEERLVALAYPALDMYTSTHHRTVVEGVQEVWERWGQSALDLAILSAAFGLLDAEQSIVPYDVTFDEFTEGELATWVEQLRLAERVQALVAQYDLVFYLLSGRFLAVLELPLEVPDTVQQIVLTDTESMSLLPASPNLHGFVADGSAAAQRWHVKASHVRGFLFKRLCRQVAWHGPIVLEWLRVFPQDTDKLFYKRVRWRPQLPMW
jgi:hypothetical protein